MTDRTIDIEADGVLEHASNLVKNARTTFLTLLLICAFCVLTMASTTDQGILLATERVKLPVVDAEVNIIGFYWSAPLLILVVYSYFLAYCHKLWLLLAEWSQPSVDSDGTHESPSPQIDRQIFPWLFIDFAKLHHDDLKAGRPYLSVFNGKMSAFFGWALAPLTLLAMMHDFVAVRIAEITVFHVLAIVYSISIGLFFHQLAKTTLARTFDAMDHTRQWKNHGWRRVAPVLLLVGSGTAVAYYDVAQLELGTTANLYRGQLNELPENWPGAILARDLTAGQGSDRIERANNLLQIQDDALNKLRQSNLRGRNLPRANLAEAFAAKIDFQSANLENADLTNTQLQESVLSGANLNGTKIRNTDMRGVRAVYASFVGTKIYGAIMRNTSLIGADFTDAEIIGGDFQGANFAGANLSGATLTAPRGLLETQYGGPQLDLTSVTFGTATLDVNGEAIPVPTIVAGTDLRNASLTIEQLSGMCGDSNTQLPYERELVEPKLKDCETALGKEVWDQIRRERPKAFAAE